MTNLKGSKFSSSDILFFTGLVIKVLLSFIIFSSLMEGFFIPFVKYYVESGFKNPYEYFLNYSYPGISGEVFPYPALMLYIMAIPKILFGWIPFSGKLAYYFEYFIFHLPLIFADIVIFWVFASWLSERRKIRVVAFYWLSPVLIYISYIYGQLDVIPIAILFVSLFFIFKAKYNVSGVFLGLAFAAKTHVALVYPFFLLYLVTKHVKIKVLILFIAISLGAFFLVNLPYLFDSSFIKMVFLNHSQSKIFLSALNLNSMSFYLLPASLMLLFIKGILLKRYNRDIFIMFLGFTFSIVLLFIPPMQGWYYWLLPFIAYFYIKEEGRAPWLFAVLQGCYFLYFLLKSLDLNNLFNYYSLEPHDEIVSLSFTILQTVLLVNCALIYRRGLKSYTKHKITSSSFLVGIGGDSGVGKTTISDSLQEIFSPQLVTILRGDGMHKWQRGHEMWNHLTHLDPKANYLYNELNVLKCLKAGKRVYRRNYDHNTGKFTNDELLHPSNLIIFDGLHPFYLEAQRKLYDLKIFIKPEQQLLNHWKIIRDTEKRGYTKEKVLEQIEKRSKDSKNFIDVQAKYADILLELKSKNPIQDLGNKSEKIELIYNLKINNSIFIEPIAYELTTIDTIEVHHDYIEEDKQIVSVEGKITSRQLDEIAVKLIPGLQEIGVSNINWPSDCLGVVMLLIVYYIFEEADNGTRK